MFKEPQMFDAHALAAMRQHAMAEYPKESCGIVVDGQYLPCKNVHPEPTEFFALDPVDMAAAYKQGAVQAIIHSHPDGKRIPSLADMEGQLNTGVPWGIIRTGKDSADNYPLMWGEGVPIAEYIGRPFINGVYDCYSLIKDYYQQEFNIRLGDRAREDGWWTKPLGENPDLYSRCYSELGFEPLPQDETFASYQPGDIIMMKILFAVPNHCAIYVGGDRALHHMGASLSSSIEGVMRWRKSIVGWYRHKDMPLKENKL